MPTSYQPATSLFNQFTTACCRSSSACRLPARCSFIFKKTHTTPHYTHRTHVHTTRMHAHTNTHHTPYICTHTTKHHTHQMHTHIPQNTTHHTCIFFLYPIICVCVRVWFCGVCMRGVCVVCLCVRVVFYGVCMSFTLLVNNMQMMTCSMLSWTDWIGWRQAGTTWA
jgi:hypothetical protein